MPELPEVEMCRRDLANWGAGRRITAVIAPDDLAVRHKLSSRPADAVVGGVALVAAALEGQVAADPVRMGKRIGWPIGEHALLVHLGMTGRWRLRPEMPRWGRFGLAFSGGNEAWFIDPRRFGCVSLVPLAEMLAVLGQGLGPDGLDEPPDADALRARLTGRRPIKPALLDQAVLAGLGNIHAAEALWRAHIHPATPCNALTAAQARALAEAIPAQLRWAVDEQSGSEELVYVTDGGDNPFAVYGRADEPCPRCGEAVSKQTMAGRSTYWCPTCQRLSRS